MPYALVDDVEIYWESHGEGRPLLTISGVSGGTWSYAESIAAWSPHFRVLVFDNLGAGLSSKPDRPYSIALMADHAAAVMDGAGAKRAYIVGLSMGGMIAQELALRHPVRVCGLVLGCTHCGGSERIPPAWEVIQRFADNKGLSPEEIVDKNLSILVTPEFLQSGSESLQRYRERQLKAPLQPDYALQRQLEAIGDFDTCDRLVKIKAPTLILTAGRDLLVPSENGRILASRIPGAAIKELTNSGHLIHLESAQTFHQSVLSFFQGLGA
jgi:pimeloyl-ACP methyl ester carboxylesterase